MVRQPGELPLDHCKKDYTHKLHTEVQPANYMSVPNRWPGVRFDFVRVRSGFLEIYHAGELLEAVVTCFFFFATTIFGAYRPEHYNVVSRLQGIVWGSLSGLTCFVVTILGQRVYVVS